MAAGYHHVTQDIRSQISVLKSTGKSHRAIARIVGHDASTISRELRRNAGDQGYRHKEASRKAMERRSLASCTTKKLTPELAVVIEEKLIKKWSPEQISGRLKLSGESISHEAIYQHVWKDKRAGGALFKHLRHHGKKYNKRSSGKAGRGCIPNRIDIKERPSIVETKSRIGDWEGDTIVGANHKGAIVSHVDRHSKYTLLKKVDRKTADCVTFATLERMIELNSPVLSITYDNGKEFSDHKVIGFILNTTCYFATPYHSWERGLNEHTNGLVRQYFPKSTDFTTISDEEVQAVEDALNDRPRKILQYRTPREVMLAQQNATPRMAILDG